MKRRLVQRVLCCAVFVWGFSLTVAFGSQLRITMTDNTSVEVPYYWIEGGEIRFEIPGGVAGVSKSQVKSIQEIIASREFDPQVMLESSQESAGSNDQKILQQLVDSEPASGTPAHKVNPEEGLSLLKESEGTAAEARSVSDRIYAPAARFEGDFAELVRPDNNGLVLVMRNILSSQSDLKSQKFMLTLYDANGNVLLQKPCELRELAASNKTLRELGVRGHLFSVVASVKPDPKIKRYEITAVQQ